MNRPDRQAWALALALCSLLAAFAFVVWATTEPLR